LKQSNLLDTDQLSHQIIEVRKEASLKGHALGRFLQVQGQGMGTHLAFCSYCYMSVSVTSEGVANHLGDTCPNHRK
jgi:hypothetical protein